MMALAAADFEFVRALVVKRAAIVLEEGKEYLVETRLLPVAKRAGFASIGQLLAELRSKPGAPLTQQVVEAMTTGETSFFRDRKPFEALRKSILPELFSRRTVERQLNIWCAACSSGQEPYSLLMLLRDHFPALSSWTMRLIASDLSSEQLERARAGRYNQFEVNRGLPATCLVKHFEQQGADWVVKQDLRRAIDFRLMNLVEAWPVLPPMDVVFMRNVLIYFSVETKKAIVGKIRRAMRSDGYLFLGAAENAVSFDEGFEAVQIEGATCFRLRR